MIFATILSNESAGAETLQPLGLRCEYRVSPVGIDVPKPGLSWRMESEAPGQRQTAYQVLVARSPEQLDRGVGDLWDSGKVVSNQSQHIPYAGALLTSNAACYWKVRVWDKDAQAGAWSQTARWTMGLLTPESWTAQWIVAPTSAEKGDGAASEQTPLLRKEFVLAEAPTFAQVTVHAPGYFQLYVNGEKVGEDVLTPAVSNLNLRTFCVSYDVARHLRAGKNCIGLWLGKGWTESMVVRAQLDAVVNGEPVVVGTGTSWQTRGSGRYRIGGNKWGDFGGERVDARETIDGWSRAGFEASKWHAAVDAEPPKGPVRAQPCPLNRLGEAIAAVAVTPLDGDQYVIDFGVNLTGWLRLKMPRLERGVVVRMRFADCRPGESRRDQSYQDFNQISEFVSAGTPDEVFEHKFNYAAFRYVIVSGLPHAPAKEDAKAFMIDSDLEEVGAFACSNDLLNRIHRVNKWTQRALNLGGYYVDCPHRERMGYGDGQVAAEGFMTSFRADGFYRKWLEDWRLLQKPDGGLPNSAPFGMGGGGPGWGGLLSALTWRHYLYYGDQRILEENYGAVRRYVDSLEAISARNDDILTGQTGKFSFIGDWVAPGRGMDTDNAPSHEARQIFNNCYRINQLELLVHMAKVLGRQDEAERYAGIVDRIRPKIHETFYDAAKQQYVLDDQAYYVMPLMTGVTPDALRPQMLQKLEQCILVKNNGHLDTGMLGTYFMMEYLRQIGRDDLIFTMFNQKTYPSWGYMLVEQGATTLWEQWNGYWSQIHSCFTSPDNWLYQGLAGIQPDPAAPGFKNIIIKPALVGDVTWVKSHHDSPYGRIVSNWALEGDRVTLTVTIPANTTATVFVPAQREADIAVNGQALQEAGHVSFVKMEGNRAVLSVGSGSYTFISARR